MKIFLAVALLSATSLFAQKNPNKGYWQQHVDYKMEVSVDVKTYKYTGTQKLVYVNNSPDTLRRVYYHLYPNAFQPGSEMDGRLQSIADPDGRMVKTFKTPDNKSVKESRISKLAPEEIGYLKISNLQQNGKALKNEVSGTILEVTLDKPLLPGKKTTFTLNFEGQVPLQIRRSGRNSAEGIALSMTQWYPKMAEYDFEGWHADPYIAREFFGVWGNFDVKITIDKNYVLGGTGCLQNADEIGKGYEKAGKAVKYKEGATTLTWHFVAPNVHDFAWAADPEYIHDKIMGENGVELHFLYKNTPDNLDGWKRLQPKTAELLAFYNKTIGTYPYKQYSVIQGGDGGMEYAMCTLITGHQYEGLVSVTTHEFGHSWFQHILGSNESKHAWMDEGFTSYAEELATAAIMPAPKQEGPDFSSFYNAYFSLVKAGKEQPMSTHSDRYDINRAYTIGSYVKGEIFLAQLGYVIGQDKLAQTIKRYYNDFKFTHPAPNDIIHTAEKVSGAELDWYLTDWTQTTNTIDYGIKEVADNGTVTLERTGRMPMPLDILVTYEDGSKESLYVPLEMMRYIKDNPTSDIARTVLPDWDWGHATYTFALKQQKAAIKSIIIDPADLMADVNRDNNVYVKK